MKKPVVAKQIPAPDRGKPLIVGIGASAGGLEAFRSFFANSAADTGMA